MRLLITGGAGFLGHHLVEHFLKNAPMIDEIVVLDKLTYASSGLDRLRDVRNVDGWTALDAIHVIGCDLSRPIPEGVARELGAVDYVIHAAAESHVDNSIVDPLPFIESNVIGTHNLLWWARSQPSIKRIFLVSTDEVYGPASWASTGNVPSDPFRPANPYAAAKAGGECLGFAYANTYKLPITIVNTMNLIGERQHPEKFVPMVIRRALAGEKVLIHADPTKTRAGARHYLHCRNFASALAFLIEKDDFGRAHPSTQFEMPNKIHVAGERELDNLELAKLIAEAVGKPLLYELVDFHSSRPGHDLRYALADGRIRSMGWKQPVSVIESLIRTVDWTLRPENRRWLDMPSKEGAPK